MRKSRVRTGLGMKSSGLVPGIAGRLVPHRIRGTTEDAGVTTAPSVITPTFGRIGEVFGRQRSSIKSETTDRDNLETSEYRLVGRNERTAHRIAVQPTAGNNATPGCGCFRVAATRIPWPARRYSTGRIRPTLPRRSPDAGRTAPPRGHVRPIRREPARWSTPGRSARRRRPSPLSPPRAVVRPNVW